MEALRLWAPIGIALAAFAWNVWLVRQGARKEALTRLEATIAHEADKLEARIIEAEKAVESKAGRPWVEGLQTQIQQIEPRVTRLEVVGQHLPTGNEFHLLALKVEAMQGDIRVIASTLKTNTEVTRRVEDFLLKEKAE